MLSFRRSFRQSQVNRAGRRAPNTAYIHLPMFAFRMEEGNSFYGELRHSASSDLHLPLSISRFPADGRPSIISCPAAATDTDIILLAGLYDPGCRDGAISHQGALLSYEPFPYIIVR